MAILVFSSPYELKAVITNPGAVSNLGWISAATKPAVAIRARISLAQATIPTAANARVQLVRKTAAATGGTGVTPALLNPSDAASSGTAAHTATGEGTDGTAPVDEGWGSSTGWLWDWSPTPEEYIVIPAGVANGLWIKHITAPPAGIYTFTMVVHELG